MHLLQFYAMLCYAIIMIRYGISMQFYEICMLSYEKLMKGLMRRFAMLLYTMRFEQKRFNKQKSPKDFEIKII